jgi:hypothetical protein
MPKQVTGSGKLASSTSSASKKVNPGGSEAIVVGELTTPGSGKMNNTPQKVNVTRSGNGRSFNP